jgi:hypothetical protein
MIQAQGADLSKWDGGPSDNLQVVDFARYRELGPFVVIKVSEGTVKDPLFDQQWAAARGHVVRTAYHFFRSFVDQKRAVQNMLEFLGSDAGELPASLDIEVSDGSSNVASLAEVWINEYNRLTGLWPFFYSYPFFMSEHSFGAKTIWGTWKHPAISKCKLWLGQWPFDELESMPGYTVRGDALRAVLIQEVIDGVRQLSWPKPLAPFSEVEIWQWTSRFPPEEIPGYYMGPNHKLAADMNFHKLSRQEFETAYPLNAAPAPGPEAYVIKRPLADYEIGFTQGDGALLLKDAVEAATENGWEAAMNGGAGFDYTDAIHAIPRTTGFETVYGIPYARILLTHGSANTQLDTVYLAPWCVLGFDAANVYLIVTRGGQGEGGMTQAEAAQYAKTLGCVDAYLMDSGHSAQIEENGTMIYWPYGPSEKVPQHIGLKRRTVTGGNVKGIARLATNIKATIAGQTPAVAQLLMGQYVYGTLVGAAASGDLVGFSHFYKADGTKVELGCVCKAYAGNLTLTNESEPSGNPEPPVPPPAEAVIDHIEAVFTDGTRKNFVAE